MALALHNRDRTLLPGGRPELGLIPCATVLAVIAGLGAVPWPAAAAPGAFAIGSPMKVTTVMKCGITDDGRLTDCLILSRTAEVPGLDERVLKAARLFKMRPTQEDGRPVAGATVRVPLVYACPRTDPSAVRCKYVGMVTLRRR